MFNLLFNPILNDSPEPWQIGFQDSAAPQVGGISDLHDSIFFYLVVISIGVFWVLISSMINFSQKNKSDASASYTVKNKNLYPEISMKSICTLTPVLLVVLIGTAFPLFNTLHLEGTEFSTPTSDSSIDWSYSDFSWEFKDKSQTAIGPRSVAAFLEKEFQVIQKPNAIDKTMRVSFVSADGVIAGKVKFGQGFWEHTNYRVSCNCELKTFVTAQNSIGEECRVPIVFNWKK